MSGSYFELVAWLRDQVKRVFCDLKLGCDGAISSGLEAAGIRE